MALCRGVGLTEVRRLSNKATCIEHHYYRNRAAALVWPWVRLFDLVILVLLRVYVPVWCGFVVVCDRFICDALVELMLDVKDDSLHEKPAGRLIVSLRPKWTVEVLLDVDEEVALQRRCDIPNRTYLVSRRHDYHLVANHLHIPMVNAERPFSVVHKEIVERLRSECSTSERVMGSSSDRRLSSEVLMEAT